MKYGSTTILFVTSRTATVYKKRGRICSNPDCKKPEVMAKDFVVSKTTSGRKKLYCIDCALQYNIITKTQLRRAKANV